MNPAYLIRGRALQCYMAEPGSLEAITKQRVKRKPSEADDELWVNMGPQGLGDSLLGLCAIKGLKKARPDKTIIYRVNETYIPFIALFDGGYDGLADHDWDHTWDEFPQTCDPRDLQINLGYKREIQHAAEITRLERYCRNLGYVTPELPLLRESANLQNHAKDYAGWVVLCPFTDLQSRDWPQFYWMALEEMLFKAGFKTLMLGSLRKNPQRIDCYKSAMALHSLEKPMSPEFTTSILLNAHCVVGCDSGLAHLAGIMGVRTLVLCGWSVGERIYNFYPHVRCLQGNLPCSGCWTCQSRGFDEGRCSVTCDNLGTILPEAVFKNITEETW